MQPETFLKQSGPGIFSVRTFVDEVRFCKINFGTEITLIKRLQNNELDRQEVST